MCGLTGFVANRSHHGLDAALHRSVGALRRRGPDAKGVWFGGDETSFVGLGHTRLAIFDPEHGQQPMRSLYSNSTMVFNGAIYNHLAIRKELEALGYVHQTQCDTEVLLNAYEHWGIRCVEKLEGMYAFAIWDAEEGKLVLGRDPFGEKPLFFSHDPSLFAFSSEIKGLLAFIGQRDVMDSSVAEYLLFKYQPSRRTMFRGISQLPPGSVAVLQRTQSGNPRITIEGFVRSGLAQVPDVTDSNVEATQAAVRNAVVSCLAGDAEIGLFLSGGVDSATIAAHAAQTSSARLKAYTLEFTGCDTSFSEAAKAHEISREFGLDHIVVELDANSFGASISEATAYRDAPLGEQNDIAMLKLAQRANQDVKVVLCGEGSDELFCGYPRYWGELYVSRAHKFLPSIASSALTSFSRHFKLPARMAVLLQAMSTFDFTGRQLTWFGGVSRKTFADVCPSLADREDPLPELRRMLGWHQERDDPVIAAMRFDQDAWLPENLLARGDRMTMAAGIEMRQPFLNQQLCTLARSFTRQALLYARDGKQPLRAAAQGLIPNAVARRAKHGFRLPFTEWSRGPLCERICDTLMIGEPLIASYFDIPSLRRRISKHMAGQASEDKLIWAAFALESFLENQKGKKV